VKRKRKTQRTGGSTRNPRSLANLKRGNQSSPGNRSAVTHGARARMTECELKPKVAEVFRALAEDAPVREGEALPNADAPVVRMLAEALVRIDRIADYLDRKGWEGEDGNPRPVLGYESRLREHALTLMRELGLTPASRAKLGVDLVRAQVVAEDAEARRARERLDRRFAELDEETG